MLILWDYLSTMKLVFLNVMDEMHWLIMCMTAAKYTQIQVDFYNFILYSAFLLYPKIEF